ncbi:MAG: hypothetical protein JRJ87_22030 [Deltaproteobacteria bacterium]|nr:hypothetical protein [Deltaproteobacteria bacterium]
MAFSVFAIFKGCTPLVAGLELPACPPDTSISCRSNEYWCELPDGRKHGFSLHLFPAGEKFVSLSYSYGKRHGWWKRWDSQGRKVRDGFYSQGGKEGYWKGWYPNGQQYYLHQYRAGARQGKWVRWTSDGRLDAEGFYDNNIKAGTWTERDEKGNLVKTKYSDMAQVE